MTEIDFHGRVAIVTGAGGGLGRTYALDLASRGASVVVNDLGGTQNGHGADVSAAQRVVDEITAAGGRAVASHDSVATREGGESIVRIALEAFGKVDILISNAGILRDRSFLKLEAEDIQSVLDVHLVGAFNVAQPAFAAMKENGYGRIVLTSSNAGVLGNFGQANYAAAKMGLVGLSNVLAIEGANSNIHSNAICPIANTRMTEDLLGKLADSLDPELVTPLVTYLVSEQCQRTHEVFSAGGGRYARMFVGLTPGWSAGRQQDIGAEDIASNIDEVVAEDGYIVPRSVQDELKSILPVLKANRTVARAVG